MQKRALLNAMFLALPIMFSSLALAASSAPPAALPQPGIGAGDHAGHAHSAGAGEAAGKTGMGGGAGKQTAWTAFPVLKTKIGGEGRERRVVTVVPQGMAANSIEAYSNNPEDAEWRRKLPLDMAGAKLDKPESGGYHWLAAREELADTVRVASTVHFFAERGGENPTAMFMQQKHELEIIPQPYPREHSRYRANEEWKFLVRFNGSPLANHKVNLETANGTRAELASDTQGMVTVRIPDDFKALAPQAPGAHDHGRRGADFVLATEHAEGGKNYLTAFNSGYGPDAFDQRSLAMGLAFTSLGMIGASPLLRRRRKTKPATVETNNKDA